MTGKADWLNRYHPTRMGLCLSLALREQSIRKAQKLYIRQRADRHQCGCEVNGEDERKAERNRSKSGDKQIERVERRKNPSRTGIAFDRAEGPKPGPVLGRFAQFPGTGPPPGPHTFGSFSFFF